MSRELNADVGLGLGCLLAALGLAVLLTVIMHVHNNWI